MYSLSTSLVYLLQYSLDKLAQANADIASQLDTIKTQDTRLKRQVDSAINAESEGQGKKRKKAGESDSGT